MDQNHQTTTGGIVIPLAQSLITGVLLGSLATALGVLLDWPKPWAIGAVVATGTTAYTWLTLLKKWQYALESLLGVDLDQDGVIGQPQPVRVVVASEDGRQGAFVDLPFSEDKLVALGRGVVQGGQSFSISSFGGRGKVFSRSEFESLRDEFIRRGLARWANPDAHQQGIELTGSGRAVVRRFASMAERSPTLSPNGRE